LTGTVQKHLAFLNAAMAVRLNVISWSFSPK